MKQIALSLFVIASSGAYVWDQSGKAPTGDVIDNAGPASAAEESVLTPPVLASPAPANPAPAPAAPSPGIPQQNVRLESQPTTPAEVGSETTAAIAVPAQEPPAAAKPPAVSQPGISQTAASTPEQASAKPTAYAAAFAATPAVYIPIPQPRPDYQQAPARVIKAAMKPTVSAATKPAAHGLTDGTYTGPVADAYYGLIQIQASIQGGRLTSLKVLKYPNDRRTSISINRQALPMLRDEAISAQSANVDIISGATLTSKAFIQSLGGALKKASS
ncbi:FMN-binding protein [Mesorhizobium sp.]|uniref:FMN-binding protein n=1 Tax=Mesorhizobium sp. TaxID=1871066 RepID=UPI003BA944F2